MDDIDEIKELIGRKGRVMIVDEEVTQRAKTLAKKAVKDNHLISSDDYRPQQDRYLAAYSAKFEEERKSLVQSLKCFPNAAAVELARKARTDKTQYNFPPSGKGPSHQRDLAVVSALHALGLSHNLEGDLEKIHDYADMYEEAVHSSEEVPWPPATF